MDESEYKMLDDELSGMYIGETRSVRINKGSTNFIMAYEFQLKVVAVEGV